MSAVAQRVGQPAHSDYRANRISPCAKSGILKTLTIIPLLGIIPQIIAGNALRTDIALSDGNPAIIAAALKIDNDFSTFAIVRTVLTVAAIVTAVATGLITALNALWFCVGFISVSILARLLTSVRMDSIKKNNELILEMNRRQAANV